MALSIKNDEADRLARALAAETGESLTDAVLAALRERLERERHRRGPDLVTRVGRLADELAQLPTLDDRTAEEIVGFDERGLPA
jgi:antitoxin VapB